MVVLGFLGALTGLPGRPALESTIAGSVPPGTEALNLRAFTEGWRRGEAFLGGGGAPLLERPDTSPVEA